MTEAVGSPMRASICTSASGVRMMIILRAGAQVSRRGGGICPSEGASPADCPTRGVDGDSVKAEEGLRTEVVKFNCVYMLNQLLI